jgi:hypothetical protein
MLDKRSHKLLAKELKNTRKSFVKTCEELGFDPQLLDLKQLGVEPCSHCSIWSAKLVLDLDDNPICYYCKDLEGM